MRKTHISMTKIPARHVFRCGYCDLQHILEHDSYQFYNAGVYGWNCDIFVDFARDVAITTGYRNTRGQRIPEELVRKYEGLKPKISDFENKYDAWRKAYNGFVADFIGELLATTKEGIA